MKRRHTRILVNLFPAVAIVCFAGDIFLLPMRQSILRSEEPSAKPRPWEGFQIQPGDDELKLFKPLNPITQDEELRKEAVTWFGVAQMEFLKGDQKRAYESLKKSYAADPDSPQLLLMLLQLAINNSQTEEAYEYSLKLSDLSPMESADIIRRLGSAFSSQPGGIPRAIQLYEHATRSPRMKQNTPFYVLLMRELGKLYLSTERRQEAATCLETVFDAIRNHEKYGLNSRHRRELLSDQAIAPEKLGDIFLEVGNYDTARAAYEYAAKGHKSAEGSLHYNLARLEMKQNAPENALAELELYFNSDSTNKVRSSLDLLQEVLSKLNRQGELTTRVEQYLNKKPNSSAMMSFLANRYADENRLQESETLIRRVLEEGDDPAALLVQAKLNRLMNKPEEYLESLSRILGRKDSPEFLDPELLHFSQEPKLWDSVWSTLEPKLKETPPVVKYETAYVAARAGMKAGKVEEVDRLIKYAIAQKQSETSRLYGELAEYYLDIDKFIEAGDLLKAGADDPTVGENRENFLIQSSQAYELGGRTETALQMIAEARKSLPDHPLLTYQEGWVFAHAGRYDDAISRFEQAIKTASERGIISLVRTSRLNLSNAHVQKGDIAKGEEILEVILKESPDDPSVNNDLGYLYADQGKNLEQARAMITLALKSDPENGAYLDSMGWVLHKLGSHDEALKYLLRSSEKSTTSSDATIWDHLGDVYQALSRFEEARQSWNKALELAKGAPKPNTELISKIEAKIK